MDAIEIPIRLTGVSRVQSQLNNVGQQLARLGGNVPMIAGGGRTPRAPRQPAQPRQPRPPKSIAQQIQDAIGTSRISFQNGRMQLNPLVNRILPIFLRLSPVLTNATIAIGAMTAAASAAAESITAFRDSQITSGGTAQQTAQLRGLGVSPELARSFGSRIASDPMAAGYAARAGVYNPGGEIFGDTNTATNLLKWAEALRKMNDTDATRAARITGTEELLKFRNISDETFRSLKKDAEQTARIMSPSQIRNASEFNVQMDRLGSAFDDLKVQLADGFIPIVTAGAKALADGVRWLNDALGGNGVGAGRTDIFGNRYAEPKRDPQVSATEANTQALRELAGILKPGIYGGGDRARGAFPSGWTGMWYDKWAKNAIGLGAFEL